MEDLMLNYSAQDILKLAELISTVSVEHYNIYNRNMVIPDYVPLDEIDLEAISSALAGISNPFGQLEEWIWNKLQGIANVIINALSSLINGAKQVIDWVWDTVQAISTALGDLANNIQKYFTSLGEGLSNIWNFLQSLPSTIVNAISNIISNVSNVVSGLATAINNLITSIEEYLQSAINTIIANISNIINVVQSSLSSVGETLSNIISNIQSAFSTIIANLENIGSNLMNAIQGIVEKIRNALSGFINNVSSILSHISSSISNALSGFVSTVEGFITTVFRNISNAISQGISTIITYIKEIPTVVSNVVSNIVSTLSNALSNLGKTLYDNLVNISKIINSALRNIWVGLTSLGRIIYDRFKDMYKFLSNLFSNVYKVLASWSDKIFKAIADIPSLLAKALKGVYDALADIGNKIASGFNWVVKEVTSVISGIKDALVKVWEAVTGLPKAIVNLGKTIYKDINYVVSVVEDGLKKVAYVLTNLSKFLTDLGEKVSHAFTFVGNAFTGFINAILKFPDWFEKNLVEPLLNGFKAVIDFFKSIDLSKIPEKVIGLFKDLIKDVLSGIKFVGSGVYDSLKWLWGKLSDFGSWLVQEVRGGLEWLWDVTKSAVTELWEALREGAVWMVNTFIINPIKGLIDDLMKGIADVFISVGKSKGKVGEYGTLTLLMLSLTGGLSIVIGIPYVIEGLAEMIKSLELAAEPLGLGGKIKADLLAVLRRIAQFFKDQGKALVQAILIGSAIQLLDPVKYIIRPFSKSFFDDIFKKIYGDKYGVEAFFETPSLEQLRNLVRRALIYVDNFRELAQGKVPSKTKTYVDAVKFLMFVRGYPFWFADYYFDLGKEFAMEIHDRFFVKRFIPLSPIFELPTHSEIIRMLQRDVFTSPVEWSKFVRVYGMSDDLAKMFYLLSFQYPSFTQLWRFMTRGISGMLWYSAPELTKEIFRTEAEWLGAGVPVDPYSLNFKADVLMNATAIYGKWIQKSNFSWFKKGMKLKYGNKVFSINFDWTADSWMLWDISADIPSKIDARWMVKWAIFDHLTRMLRLTSPSAGTSPSKYPEKPFVDLVKAVVESRMYTDISMDLRPFCRMLVANGLHPAWVPLVAVAEAINALSDERTLLRTGFLNLFKEGAWDYEILDSFLDGMLIASFAIEYFDVETKKWYSGAINLPVRFLPAERKMLELRAIFDRALDIIREYLRLMAKGVSQLILKPSEAMEKIKGYVEGELGEWFGKATELAVGKTLPLKVDTAWVNTYIKYYEELRDIETIMRARYYTRYLIYSLMWRFREGWITKEEMIKTLDKLVDEIRESPLFKKLLVQVATVMVETFKRELYGEYVISLLKRRKISKEEAVQMLTKAGMTEDIAKLYVDAKFTPYSVSLTTLATLCEVVPQAVNYALDSLKIFGFNPDELIYWSIYVAKKPYINEMTLVRTRIYECLAENVPQDLILDVLNAYAIVPEWKGGKVVFKYGKVAQELVKYYEKHKEVLEGMGFDVREWIAFNLIAELEKLKRDYHEKTTPYIPTPLTLAGMMEYITIPDELIENVFTYNRVPPEWVPIWRKYFKVKPVFNDVRLVVSALVRAIAYSAISEDKAEKIWNLIKKYGYTDIEIYFQKLRADLELAVEMARGYIPTPGMLADVSEIIPWARKLLPDVIKAKRIKGKWVELWEAFVQVKPIIDDVKNLIRQVSRLYTNFFVKEEDLRKVLDVLPMYGWEPTEIEMLQQSINFELWYNAFKNIIGTPRELVVMAEYSPTARTVALGQIYKMIDALPIDPKVKELLKAMWEEYVRVKPVHDEVKRYITELIDDVQYGLLTIEEFRQELEKLKKWGIDDYEIEFYVELAQMRRARQIVREELYYYRRRY